MTPGGAAAAAAIAVLTLGACGTTYIDTSATTAPGVVTTTTLPAVAADAALDDLLAEIDVLLRHLDEQIVDDDQPAATLARIDELWVVAEAQIRTADPDALFPFQQALELARSGVERRRPADASKGYKLLIAAIPTVAANSTPE